MPAVERIFGKRSSLYDERGDAPPTREWHVVDLIPKRLAAGLLASILVFHLRVLMVARNLRLRPMLAHGRHAILRYCDHPARGA